MKKWYLYVLMLGIVYLTIQMVTAQAPWMIKLILFTWACIPAVLVIKEIQEKH